MKYDEIRCSIPTGFHASQLATQGYRSGISQPGARIIPVAGVRRLNSPIVVSEQPEANSATSTANLSIRGAVPPQPIAGRGRSSMDSDEHFREFCVRGMAIAGYADAVIKRHEVPADPVFIDSSPIPVVPFLAPSRRRHA